MRKLFTVTGKMSITVATMVFAESETDALEQAKGRAVVIEAKDVFESFFVDDYSGSVRDLAAEEVSEKKP